MELAHIAPSLASAGLSVEQLSGNSRLSEPEKVKRLSQQFEALLARQILQEARKTVIPSKFTTDSATSAIYQDMINFQLAEGISQSGGLGLADTLQAQLTRQLGHSQAERAAPPPPSASTPDQAVGSGAPDAMSARRPT